MPFRGNALRGSVLHGSSSALGDEAIAPASRFVA